MTEMRDEHFEVISENRARAHEQQKEMRQELIEWVKTCDKLQMGELYSEMKRMKRSWNE